MYAIREYSNLICLEGQTKQLGKMIHEIIHKLGYEI